MKVYFIFDDNRRMFWNVEQKQWRIFEEDGTPFVTKQGAIKELESFKDSDCAIIIERFAK